MIRSMLNKIKWKRISYAYQDIEVIKDGISNSDIYQGSLGNCYLLSSIASVSEFPDRIERLLIQRKRSPKGAYCVALCIVGDFKEFYIDDLVPTLHDRVCFCHNSQAEIWAILIEKAYAKAYGGYWNTGAGGQSDNALFDLTGAPTEMLKCSEFEDLDKMFNRIHESDKMNYIMNASSKGAGEKMSDLGIISGHA